MLAHTLEWREESVLMAGIYPDVRSGKLLMPFTRSASYNPPKWKLPGGGVQVNETAEKAVVREYFEETGLVVAEIRYFGFTEKPSRISRDKTHKQHLFGAIIPDIAGFKPSTWDGDELLTNVFFPVDDIKLAITHRLNLGGHAILNLHVEHIKKAFNEIFKEEGVM